MCRYLSVARITCTLPDLPTIFAIRASPASVCSFNFFVTVVCLPVYSTSILFTSCCDPPQTISVHDVGVYLESAYLRDTWPLSFASPESPAAAARPPVDRPSEASARLRPQSASSPCASTAPAADRHPPAHSRLQRRRTATQTRPPTYARIYSPPPG